MNICSAPFIFLQLPVLESSVDDTVSQAEGVRDAAVHKLGGNVWTLGKRLFTSGLVRDQLKKNKYEHSHNIHFCYK